MNKKEFIESLSLKTGLSIDESRIVNEILENNFFISKKSKNKIINEMTIKLDIKENKAEGIYEKAKSILNEEIKKKLKNPFKSKN